MDSIACVSVLIITITALFVIAKIFFFKSSDQFNRHEAQQTNKEVQQKQKPTTHPLGWLRHPDKLGDGLQNIRLSLPECTGVIDDKTAKHVYGRNIEQDSLVEQEFLNVFSTADREEIIRYYVGRLQCTRIEAMRHAITDLRKEGSLR